MICKLCGATVNVRQARYVPNRLGETVPLCKSCFLLLETKTILAFFDASIRQLVKELKHAKFEFALDSMRKIVSSSGKGD